jgi:hypothetical protein
MMPDYKSRELTLYHNDGYKLRIEPVVNNADVGPSFLIKTTNLQGAGDWGLYVPGLKVDTMYGVRGVGSLLGTHEYKLISLDQNLQLETKAREDADVAINLSISTESKARVDGDLVHTNAIAAETAARISADVVINAAISTESSQRQAADLIHTSSIAQVNLDLQAESKARSDGDAKSAADLALESKARSDADSKLTSDLAAESTRAQAAEVKVAGDLAFLTNSVNTDVKRLDERINFIASNTDQAALDSLTEIVNNFNVNGAGYASRLTYLEGVIADLVNKSQ